MYSSSIANKVYCLNKKLVYTFILIYPLLFSNLVLALNLPLIQDGGLTPVTAPPNYLYSKIEIGDYKNYCEYGNMPIAFSTYSLNILTVYTQIQSTNTPSIIGCMPIVNNNNEAAYRYLRFELIDKDNSCPSIKMESVNPIGDIPIDSPNVKISNQSFYHGYNEDEIYAPKIGYGNKELNYCYYLLQLLNTNRENANDKVVYFHLYPNNLDVFVKGDNYSQQYTKKNIDGINYFTSDLYEPIDKYYRLPKMDLGYFEQNNISKYWKNEDFNFNKGKYLSTNTKETNGKVEASNVMFFPGVLGSQLFQTEPYSTSTAMVWPSFSTASQIKMRISNPERIYDSTNYINPSNIHAYNDVKSIVDGGVTKTIGTLDIYKSFLDELDSLQSSNQIADYSAIPYDFRLSTDDIYCNAGMYFGIDKSRVYYDTRSNRSTSNYSKCYNSYIYGELKRLVLSSKTGHVTLIGHSYGGLVIKEILKQLEDTHDPLIGSIDKVILVAVPQAGSPEAVVSLLHGVDIGMLGYPMTAEVERDLALTFPSSYQILPNDSLIKSISNSGVNIISFKNKDLLVATSSPSDYSKSIKAYGLTIDTASELYSYILAKDNRVYATSTSDLHRAAKGISQLMDHIITEKEKLDNYVPTSTIQVTQIAGWGIPTDIGYSYDYTDPKSCTQYMATNTMMSSTPNYNCVNVGPSPLLHVTRSRNGDDTVTVPSALWMDTASHTNVKNLWVDLEAVNQTKLVIFDTHKNIFSIRSLQNVIVSILKGHITNEKYIYNKAPEYINAKTNYRNSVKNVLTFHFY